VRRHRTRLVVALGVRAVRSLLSEQSYGGWSQQGGWLLDVDGFNRKKCCDEISVFGGAEFIGKSADRGEDIPT
jgi:hypothetical protein